jgi:hypothetical protein
MRRWAIGGSVLGTLFLVLAVLRFVFGNGVIWR